MSGQTAFAALGEKRQLAKHARAVIQTTGRMPRIDTSRLQKLERTQRGLRLSKRQILALRNFHSNCVGHLLADYYFNVLRGLLRKYCDINSLQKEVARAQMVSLFANTGLRERRVRTFYQRQLAGIRLTKLEMERPSNTTTTPTTEPQK